MSLPTPSPTVLAAPYRRILPRAKIDLWLDGNEGPALDDAFAQAAAALLADPERWRRYPDASPLQAALARHFGLDPQQVLLGAGADELLDRSCRAWLCDGRRLATPTPCFPMLPRYVAAAGAELLSVPWLEGALPVTALREAAQTAHVVAITSPNNPTGLVADATAVLALADEFPDRLFLLDLAYVEFADRDPTTELLTRDNVLVVRTFSKALGLAGLRVGYALGNGRLIDVLRAVGSPYPCSSLSLLLCERALTDDSAAPRLAAVRRERAALASLLVERGLSVLESQGNFVFARTGDPLRAVQLASALAGCGIAIRVFGTDDPQLADAVRITCPGHDDHQRRLLAALATALPTGATR